MMILLILLIKRDVDVDMIVSLNVFKHIFISLSTCNGQNPKKKEIKIFAIIN